MFLFHGLLTFCIHFVTYWGMVIKYDEKIILDPTMNSLKNQFGATLPLSLLLFNDYYPVEYGNIFASLICIPFIICVSDIYFYCTHRPLHTALLWGYHRTHHHNTVIVAKSLDADMLEHVVGNLGSFIVGFLILRYFGFIFNIYIYHIWVFVSTVSTCASHAEKRVLGDIGIHSLHHKYLKFLTSPYLK